MMKTKDDKEIWRALSRSEFGRWILKELSRRALATQWFANKAASKLEEIEKKEMSVKYSQESYEEDIELFLLWANMAKEHAMSYDELRDQLELLTPVGSSSKSLEVKKEISEEV